MLPQVGPSWPQDASMLAQVCLKMAKMASLDLQNAKIPRFLIQNCSFWNTQNLENIEKSIFSGSVCNLHFFLALNACLGLQVASSSLQVGSCWSQVGLKLAQVGLKLPQVGLKLPPDGLMLVQVGPTWLQLAPTWLNLAPSWGQLGSKLAQVEAKLAPSWPKLA